MTPNLMLVRCHGSGKFIKSLGQGHAYLRKVLVTLPYPYPARGSWRTVVLNRWQ
jgi:hypothetical protein